MRILKTSQFSKDAEAEGLTDSALQKAIQEFEQGLVGNALGGNLFKKRVAVGGKGKSGGLRTILVHKVADDKVFCLYVFSKKERDNITGKELKTFRELAGYLLELTEEQIEKSIELEQLIEVI